MPRTALTVLSLAALCTFLPAQSSTPAVFGTGSDADLVLTGSINEGDVVVVGVQTSKSGLPAYLGVSLKTGSSTYDMGPLGLLHLDLSTELIVLPLGVTDQAGDVWASFPMPAGMATPPPGYCYLQAVLVGDSGIGDGNGQFLTTARGSVPMGDAATKTDG